MILPGRADAVIFVLLDAFRPDYLVRTRFLKELATRSLVGQLEEPFGFCPRGAYFGGLTMAEQGYTHLFRYDPVNSVFRWTRDLAGAADDAVVRVLRTEIVNRARTQLPAFSAKAVNPWGIPLEWQRYFDFSEREAPWSRRAGYRSLFHELDDAGQPWLELSWPFSGYPDDVSDGVVAGEGVRRLTSDHRFAFLHLPSLDALGHQFGPGSSEVQAQLGAVDRLAEVITNRALDLFDDPVLIFAGDHGMLPVVGHANPAAALQRTGLRFGLDYAFFVDSTMVRCWCFTAAARRIVRAALDEFDGGRWLDEDDKRRWQIDGIDPRNGEEYFLADPGVLFSPSFFDWTGAHAPRGMHGYAPDAADNRAMFLAHRPRSRASGDVGVVEARRLYPTFLEWLGWDANEFTPALPIGLAEAPRQASRWYLGRPASADAVVDAHLSHAVHAIVQRAPATTSVVLTGGFGRGEGTPADAGHEPRPANDYDLVVLGPSGHQLGDLGDELARTFDLDFVDVTSGPTLEVQRPPKLGDFDLRYGARVLWGDPTVVERLGPIAPADLDRVEAAFLIGNRTGGMLLGLTGERATPGDEARYRARQTSKFFIAVADAWLISIGDYAVSYATRQRRFAALAQAAKFTEATIKWVDRAYAAKLGHLKSEALLDAPCDVARGALFDLERVLGWTSDPAERSALVREAVRRHLSGGTSSVAEAVYAAVRGVFLAWPDGSAAQGQAARLALGERFGGADSVLDADAARTVARLWLGFFH